MTHICARGDNEVVIVDLWESEEDLQRMMEDPEFLRNLEAAGWPSEPIEQTYQVHATFRDQLIQRRCGPDGCAWPGRFVAKARSTFGPHAIGAERFATVSSGLQR